MLRAAEASPLAGNPSAQAWTMLVVGALVVMAPVPVNGRKRMGTVGVDENGEQAVWDFLDGSGNSNEDMEEDAGGHDKSLDRESKRSRNNDVHKEDNNTSKNDGQQDKRKPSDMEVEQKTHDMSNETPALPFDNLIHDEMLDENVEVSMQDGAEEVHLVEGDFDTVVKMNIMRRS